LVGFAGASRAAAAGTVKPDRADVTVVVIPKTTADALNAGNLTYDIVAVNRGTDWAHNTTITVPFASTALKLAGVTFSGAPAWVKVSETTYFEIEIGRLDSGGGTMTATARFVRLPGAPKTAGLTERIAFTWDDDLLGGGGTSNIPTLTAQPMYRLELKPIAGQEKMEVMSGVFAPGEPVTFWCNHPDGSVDALRVDGSRITMDYDSKHSYGEYARADSNGLLNIQFAPTELGSGRHTVVVYGSWTHFAAVGEILR
jgi:hypothetical protein